MWDFLKEFILFIKENKKWWLVPMIVVMLLLGLVIVVGQGTALAPFVYTFF